MLKLYESQIDKYRSFVDQLNNEKFKDKREIILQDMFHLRGSIDTLYNLVNDKKSIKDEYEEINSNFNKFLWNTNYLINKLSMTTPHIVDLIAIKSISWGEYTNKEIDAFSTFYMNEMRKELSAITNIPIEYIKDIDVYAFNEAFGTFEREVDRYRYYTSFTKTERFFQTAEKYKSLNMYIYILKEKMSTFKNVKESLLKLKIPGLDNFYNLKDAIEEKQVENVDEFISLVPSYQTNIFLQDLMSSSYLNSSAQVLESLLKLGFHPSEKVDRDASMPVLLVNDNIFNREKFEVMLKYGLDMNRLKLIFYHNIQDEKSGFEFLTYLISKGLNINMRNKKRETYLMLTARKKQDGLIKKLIELGATTLQTTKDDETVLEIYVLAGGKDKDVLRLLR